jgi:hypothetical protein
VNTKACGDYCTLVNQNCTGTTNAQYSDFDCKTACTTTSAWDLGTTGATSGNTLDCRVTYANLAASDPATNCTIAGMRGGGVCGKRCDGFCRLVDKNCTGANQIYADDAACQAACAQWTPSKVDCVIYHMNAAGIDPVTHCPHGTPTSHACG